MFKRISVVRRNLVGEDGGLGCGVDGVYKKKMVSEKERKKKGSKIEKEQKEHQEKKVNNVFFYITLASSVRLGLRHLLTHSLIISLSSLFSSSGKALSCRLIPSLTNFLIWARVELCKSTILNGVGLQDILVHTHTYIYIYNMLDLYWSHFWDSYWRKTNRTKTW